MHPQAANYDKRNGSDEVNPFVPAFPGVAVTFIGRTSALPTILRRCEGSKKSPMSKCKIDEWPQNIDVHTRRIRAGSGQDLDVWPQKNRVDLAANPI